MLLCQHDKRLVVVWRGQAFLEWGMHRSVFFISLSTERGVYQFRPEPSLKVEMGRRQTGQRIPTGQAENLAAHTPTPLGRGHRSGLGTSNVKGAIDLPL
jgi:hypothetical protein